MIKKLLFLLVLLMTAATGAVAQTETLLTTITATAKEQASYSTANVATVSFSYTASGSSAYLANWGWWGYGWIATVTAAEGYTITKCIFYDDADRTATDSEAPFVVETTDEDKTPRINGTPIDGGNQWSKGIKKIEVYGYVTPTATKYAVTLKDGVKDADKWTVKVGDGQAQALPIGGLKGDGSETVTLQYNGRLKVKGVKATSDAAAPSVPDGALNGKFSVSDGKQVYFSKGNLRYASSKWSFFDNQYDYYTSYSADAWDHFGWSTSTTDYGMNTSTSNSDYSGDFVDWGATMGTGWFTLTSAEWTYLFNTRSASTVGGTENGRYAKAKVNDVQGVILFPDTYTHPDGVTAPTGVNAEDATGWNGNSYTAADWTKMESAGCVFLPAAGTRNGTAMNGPGTYGYYWSATPNTTGTAYRVYSNSDYLSPENSTNRRFGISVRLVQAVSDAGAPAAKVPATVTTAPTGAAIVGVGKTTALVSGGVADGGTLMYAVTTTNTKPTSTDGFSDAVPTAQTITASGKVYVWYYVKGDDTHSDSEIAGPVSVTLVEVITWNTTNVFNSSHKNDKLTFTKKTPLVYEGITISYSGDDAASNFNLYVDKGGKGKLQCYGQNGAKFTFTAPSGKKFVRIEMTDDDSVLSGDANWIEIEDENKLVWSGTPSNTVEIAGDNLTKLATLNTIVFNLVDAE